MSTPLPAGLKELTPLGYLGIDFGTSNTHIAVCYLDGNGAPQTIPLAGKTSVPTCLLWKEPGQTDDDVVAFGDKALRKWLTMSDADRGRHRFAAAFKPDIANGDRAARAQRDAQAFLHKCYQSVREGGVLRAVGVQEGVPVVIGIPAEVGREQKDLTARLASAAGFGETAPIEEPLGALAFHLADGSVTAAEVRRGVIVVDFGGGTLDVAWLDARHGLAVPWGDPTLGGRLFDDLFYQWLLEQNPTLDLAERDRLYVWQASCRDLKEKFSEWWKEEGPDAEFVSELKLPGRGGYANFSAAARAFLKRASHYSPSPLATAYFAKVGGRLAELGCDGSVDLIARIRDELARGLEGRQRDIARVILTGGSGKWPFMRHLAAQVFGAARESVLLSPDPETTVGSGLAVYHVLKYRNDQKRLKLYEELPEYKRKLSEEIGRALDRFAEEVAAALVTPLAAQVEAAYLDWYRHGGTLDEVQLNIQMIAVNFDAAAHVQGREALLAANLMRLVRDHLALWLREYGIKRGLDEVAPAGAIVVAVPPMNRYGEGIAQIVSDVVGVTLVGAVFSVVLVALHGAHILVDPLLGIPVALGSAALSWAGFKAVEDKLQPYILAYHWGPPALKALSLRLSEQQLRREIAKSCEQAAKEIRGLLRGIPGEALSAKASVPAQWAARATAWLRSGDPDGPAGPAAASPVVPSESVGAALWKTVDELQAAVVAQFDQMVHQVINDLGVLEEIRKGGN
jgi:molecular chaperone DnaK